jgi:hypothetical protein
MPMTCYSQIMTRQREGSHVMRAKKPEEIAVTVVPINNSAPPP